MLGGGEETSLSRAGWRHLGASPPVSPSPSPPAASPPSSEDEYAFLHSRELSTEVLASVCWEPTMEALHATARTAAARAESESARRRAEAKHLLEVRIYIYIYIYIYTYIYISM